MSDLQSLLLKIEHATEPSRELDAEIMFDLYAKPVGKRKEDDGPVGYLWPEDNPSWSFGIRFPGKDMQWFLDSRKRIDGETLVIERDHALVLMNALRIPRVTASIDAALTLLNKVGILLNLSDIAGDGLAYAHVGCPCNGADYRAYHPKLAMALCLACVKAHAQLA